MTVPLFAQPACSVVIDSGGTGDATSPIPVTTWNTDPILIAAWQNPVGSSLFVGCRGDGMSCNGTPFSYPPYVNNFTVTGAQLATGQFMLAVKGDDAVTAKVDGVVAIPCPPNCMSAIPAPVNITPMLSIGTHQLSVEVTDVGYGYTGLSYELSFCPNATNTPTPTNTGTLVPTNTPTITPTDSPTSTPTNSPTISPSNTSTNTPTISPTVTPTSTPTLTPTQTPTSTITNTPTITSTPTNSPTATPTLTPTSTPVDIFYVDKNLFNPTNDKAVSITVVYNWFPGEYSLRIYNTAGEHIRTFEARTLTGPLSKVYPWDGTNKNGDACASGVYIIYLHEPFSRKVKRILLVR